MLNLPVKSNKIIKVNAFRLIIQTQQITFHCVFLLTILNALNTIKLFKLHHSVYIMYQSHSDVCNKNILLCKILLTLSFIVCNKNHSIACFITIYLCNGQCTQTKFIKLHTTFQNANQCMQQSQFHLE